MITFWDDFLEITKIKPEKDETQTEAKKTPRKNWEVKKEAPVSRVVITETLKVLMNPYLGREEKISLLADI